MVEAYRILFPRSACRGMDQSRYRSGSGRRVCGRKDSE